MALVGELACECVQHGLLIPISNTVVVGEERHDIFVLIVTDRLVHDNVAALHHGRCGCVVLIDDGRMPAVLVDVEILCILLVDDAVRSIRIATVETGDAALACVDLFSCDIGDRTRADILVVLIIAIVAALVDPLRAVLQIEVCLAAAVNKTVQIGLVREERRLQLSRGQRKEIPVELYVGDVAARLSVAGLCAVISHIHGDLALVGGEGIVAVLRSCGHLNGAAARDANCAVLGIRRDPVAVDGHIHITVYSHIALFHLCEDAGIVKA